MGIEPTFSASKAVVLPLDDPGVVAGTEGVEPPRDPESESGALPVELCPHGDWDRS